MDGGVVAVVNAVMAPFEVRAPAGLPLVLAGFHDSFLERPLVLVG